MSNKKNAVIVIIITVVFLAGGIALFVLAVPSLREAVFVRTVRLDDWPAYDADFRLERQSEAPTDEELARYIATKIPDEYKNDALGVKVVKRFEAVALMPDPAVEPEPRPTYLPPYDGLVVEKVCTAYVVTVIMDCRDAGSSSEAAVYSFQQTLYEDIKEGSYYPFSKVSFDILRNGDNVYPTLENNSQYPVIALKKYEKTVPDFEVYSPAAQAPFRPSTPLSF